MGWVGVYCWYWCFPDSLKPWEIWKKLSEILKEGYLKRILANFPFESLQQQPSLALLLTQVNIHKLNSNHLGFQNPLWWHVTLLNVLTLLTCALSITRQDSMPIQRQNARPTIGKKLFTHYIESGWIDHICKSFAIRRQLTLTFYCSNFRGSPWARVRKFQTYLILVSANTGVETQPSRFWLCSVPTELSTTSSTLSATGGST